MLLRLLIAAAVLLTPLLLARERVVNIRERAVMIYPRERYLFRRVFYNAHQRELRERIGERYDIEVHEQIASDDALFDVDIDGANLLVLSAHGDPFSMYFAGRDERTLDSTDREELKAFFDRLDPNATIVLQSCHTGRGFAHLVKDAAGPGREVIAARGWVPKDGMEVTSVAPFDVKIHCGDAARRWDCTVRLR